MKFLFYRATFIFIVLELSVLPISTFVYAMVDFSGGLGLTESYYDSTGITEDDLKETTGIIDDLNAKKGWSNDLDDGSNINPIDNDPDTSNYVDDVNNYINSTLGLNNIEITENDITYDSVDGTLNLNVAVDDSVDILYSSLGINATFNVIDEGIDPVSTNVAIETPNYRFGIKIDYNLNTDGSTVNAALDLGNDGSLDGDISDKTFSSDVSVSEVLAALEDAEFAKGDPLEIMIASNEEKSENSDMSELWERIDVNTVEVVEQVYGSNTSEALRRLYDLAYEFYKSSSSPEEKSLWGLRIAKLQAAFEDKLENTHFTEKEVLQTYIEDFLGIECDEEDYDAVTSFSDWEETREQIFSKDFYRFVEQLKQVPQLNFEKANLSSVIKLEYNEFFKETVFDPEFLEFIEIMQDSYNLGFFSNYEYIFEIFWSPNDYETYTEEENIALAEKIRTYFPEISIYACDLDDFKEIKYDSYFKNIDDYLNKTKDFYDRLKEQYPNISMSIEGISILANWDYLSANDIDFHLDDVLCSEKAKDIYNILEKNFDFILCVNTRDVDLLQLFANFVGRFPSDSISQLSILKEYGIKNLWISDLKEISGELLSELSSTKVQKLYDQIVSYYGEEWYGLEAWWRPEDLYNFVDFAECLYSEEFIHYWHEYGDDLKTSSFPEFKSLLDSSDGYENFKLLLEKFPNIKLKSTDLAILAGKRDLLNSGTTWEIYEMLTSQYQLTSLSEEVFSLFQQGEGFLEVIKNEKFYDLYSKMKEIYWDGKRNEETKFSEFFYSIYDLYKSSPSMLEKAVSSEAQLLAKFTTLIRFYPSLDLKEFIEVIEQGDEDLQKLLQTLNQDYDDIDMEMSLYAWRNFIENRDLNVLSEGLNSSICKSLFHKYRELLDIDSMYALSDLVRLSKIERIENVIENVLQLSSLKVVNPSTEEEYKTLGMIYSLIQGPYFDYLNGEEFIKFKDFHDSVVNECLNYEPDKFDLDFILDLCHWVNLQENPSFWEDELFSDKFSEIHQLLKNDFHLTYINSKVLKPILQLSGTIGEIEEVKELINGFDGDFTANDLFILSVINQSPELKGLLEDKEKLINLCGSIYQREPVFRTLWGGGAKENYTERPDLENLSNIALLRLYLLNEGLKSSETLNQLRNIVMNDVEDTSTEYGGVITYNEHLLNFNFVKSSIHNHNGAYSNLLDKWLYGGIMSFHLHALTYNESKYAGPSGRVGGQGGDIPYVDYYNLTDVVITPLGKAGDRILINVDMYWVTEGGEERIIDLGVFRI